MRKAEVCTRTAPLQPPGHEQMNSECSSSSMVRGSTIHTNVRSATEIIQSDHNQCSGSRHVVQVWAPDGRTLRCGSNRATVVAPLLVA